MNIEDTLLSWAPFDIPVTWTRLGSTLSSLTRWSIRNSTRLTSSRHVIPSLHEVDGSQSSQEKWHSYSPHSSLVAWRQCISLHPAVLPVSVTNITVNTRVIIDVPGPESLFRFTAENSFCIPELRWRVRDPLREHSNEALLLGNDVPLGVLPLLLRRHREPMKVENQGPGTEVIRVAAGQKLEIQSVIGQN